MIIGNGRQQRVVRTGSLWGSHGPPTGQPAACLECGPSGAQLEIWGLMGIFKCQQLFRLKQKQTKKQNKTKKRRGESWRIKKKLFGTNKTNLKAK